MCGKKCTTQEQIDNLLQKSASSIDYYNLKKAVKGLPLDNDMKGKQKDEEDKEDPEKPQDYQDANQVVNVIFGGDT